MPRTRCYQDGALVDEHFPLAEVSEHLQEPNSMVWVHLPAPDAHELGVLADELGLHALAVEDATNPRERPKLDRYSDHSFLSAYSVTFDRSTSELKTAEIAAFITSRALITVGKDDGFDLARVIARWDTTSDLAKHGMAFLVHGLLDELVDGYFDTVQAFDDEIDELEDLMFDPSAPPQDVQRRSFKLRKSLVSLRRVVLPMREVVNALLRRDLDLINDAMAPYFHDLYDHVLRVTEWTESLRDLVATATETNLTIQGNRLNVITKKVTSYAAIIAVPTAITGFYGQNVPYPGFSMLSGFYTSSAVIVALSAMLYVLFKRANWL